MTGARVAEEQRVVMAKSPVVMKVVRLVILALPELVRVMVWVLEEPTGDAAEVEVVGEAARWERVPVPVRGTVEGEAGSELVRVRAPVAGCRSRWGRR